MMSLSAQELARAARRKCFCNGPCCVKSPSDRHVAGLLLLFVVSAGLPHHAVREETASPSKTRDPLSRVLTALLTALPLPSSQRRDLRGAEPISPAPNLLLLPVYAAAASRPQRNVVPFTHMRCKMTASLRANATFARFMPRRRATSSAQRLRAEKRTARVSRMCAPSRGPCAPSRHRPG